MSCTHCLSPVFARLSRAMAKSLAAKVRSMGALRLAPDWATRAQTCERCPLRHIVRGKSYCGSPLLQKLHRDETIDGCGCPTIAKAKDPSEHCPIDARYNLSHQEAGRCTCRWCQATTVSMGGAGVVLKS